MLFALVTLMAASCKKGLDPIKEVAPGPDLLPPVVEITYPVEGKTVRSADALATITVKFVASDDIELQGITLAMDGTQFGSITSFLDYRRAVVEYPYKDLADGDHIMLVTAVDMTGKSTSQSVSFKKITAPPYVPMEGEVIYFPFDGNYYNLITGSEAGVVGSPSFVSGKVGDAYAGATDSYVTYPSAEIAKPAFSVAFWYKLNPDPKRGGMISISPEGDDRKVGFRFFREDGGAQMKFGINFGIGADEVWMNPFLTVDPGDEWMHFAVTIDGPVAKIYVDGEVVMEKTDVAGTLDWTGCPSMSIGSGAPNFTYWEHFSDLSYFDEMHFFTRAITGEEVLKLYNVK
jgi:hypothetical protein